MGRGVCGRRRGSPPETACELAVVSSTVPTAVPETSRTREFHGCRRGHAAGRTKPPVPAGRCGPDRTEVLRTVISQGRESGLGERVRVRLRVSAEAKSSVLAINACGRCD
jgi:hypothetical protein